MVGPPALLGQWNIAGTAVDVLGVRPQAMLGQQRGENGCLSGWVWVRACPELVAMRGRLMQKTRRERCWRFRWPAPIYSHC